MKFAQSCPINFEKVDENIIRLQASIITVLGILYFFTVNPLILFLLLYDFIIRIAGYKNISPIVIIANFFAYQFSFAKKIVDGGSKKFAAQIGLIFVIVANLFYYLNFKIYYFKVLLGHT